MLFNSLEYLLFLPTVAMIYFALPHKHRWILLLTASYFFYMSWRPDFAVLIIASTGIDYLAGIKMGAIAEKAKRKKWLYLSLFVNLGMLCSFKYLGFLNETLRDVFGLFGHEYPVGHFDILLPIGISYYTFQTLSYTIDVYRGNKTPEKHFGIFATYVAFFPQLIGGPIETSTRFLPQFFDKHVHNWRRTVEGIKLIVWGLFKKMVIADNVALLVDATWANAEAFTGPIWILAMVGIVIQIYADCSAYADIAIGSARIFGFRLTDNFRRPYLSTTMGKLWKRWHISLIEWIYEYIRTPLYANAKTAFRRNLYIYVIFIIIALWHEAGWSMVVFGILHATYLLIHYLTKTPREKLVKLLRLDKAPILKKNIDILIVMILWTFGGIFFRSHSISDAWHITTHMFDSTPVMPYLDAINQFNAANVIAVIGGCILVWWFERNDKVDLRHPFSHIKSSFVRGALYFAIIFTLIVFEVNVTTPFYYLQY